MSVPLRKKKMGRDGGLQLQWIHDHLNHVGDDCLIWPFSTHKDGRGQVAVGKWMKQAHRVMCELKHGAPPTPLHEAAHVCGKGHLGCVHPEHLGWKTHVENIADKKLHGTHLCGEKTPWAKLSEVDVVAIRILAGMDSYSTIAARFGISGGQVVKIVNRQRWSHI